MNYIIGLLTLLSSSLFSTTALADPAMGSPSVISHAELLKVASGLGMVLLIILVLSWLVKRLNAVSLISSKGFQTLGSMTLGPKEKVVLIKAGDRYLLIGVGGGVVNMLHDFGEQMPQGFSNSDKPTFAEIFKSAVRKS